MGKTGWYIIGGLAVYFLVIKPAMTPQGSGGTANGIGAGAGGTQASSGEGGAGGLDGGSSVPPGGFGEIGAALNGAVDWFKGLLGGDDATDASYATGDDFDQSEGLPADYGYTGAGTY